MAIIVLALVFTSLWKLSVSVICYKCSAEIGNLHAPPCDQFDPNDPRFYKDCPYSTICFKRESTLLALGSPAKYTERGCASQLLNGDQEKINGKWHQVKHIYEEYQETCTEDSNDSQRSTKTINCYCRGDYCNSSVRNYVGFKSMLGFFIVAFIVI